MIKLQDHLFPRLCYIIWIVSELIRGDNSIFTQLLKFVDLALLKATKEESKTFAEIQNVKIIEHGNGQYLVVGNHLEEIYGNHKTPKDQWINLDLLRQNIMNHFERIYTNGITHIMGTSKNNCRKITK